MKASLSQARSSAEYTRYFVRLQYLQPLHPPATLPHRFRRNPDILVRGPGVWGRVGWVAFPCGRLDRSLPRTWRRRNSGCDAESARALPRYEGSTSNSAGKGAASAGAPPAAPRCPLHNGRYLPPFPQRLPAGPTATRAAGGTWPRPRDPDLRTLLTSRCPNRGHESGFLRYLPLSFFEISNHATTHPHPHPHPHPVRQTLNPSFPGGSSHAISIDDRRGDPPPGPAPRAAPSASPSPSPPRSSSTSTPSSSAAHSPSRPRTAGTPARPSSTPLTPPCTPPRRDGPARPLSPPRAGRPPARGRHLDTKRLPRRRPRT